MSRKRIIRIVIGLILCLVITVGVRADLSTNNSTAELNNESPKASTATTWTQTTFMQTDTVKKDVDAEESLYPSDVLIEDDQLVCESAILRMYYNEDTSILKIEDKRNGYIWSSGCKNEITEDLSSKWADFSHCLLTAEFIMYPTMSLIEMMPKFERQKTTYFDKGFSVNVYFKKANYYVTVSFTLDEDRLIVEIPDQKFVSKDSDKKYVLSKLKVLPFFGASMAGTGAGYLFIPDGSGALIRYGEEVGSGSYTGRVFGEDNSINGIGLGSVSLHDYARPECEIISVPVYGISHGNRQNSVLFQIENGAEYCNILANPAGNAIDWYWISSQFLYNLTYSQQDNTGSAFTLCQSSPNEVNAKLSLTFLVDKEATYVGMAHCYREDLIKKGALLENQTKKENIPLLLDCLMGESEDSGLFVSGLTATKLSDLSDWNNVLSKAGIGKTIYSLRGASKGGYSREKVTDYKLWNRIGTLDDLHALEKQGLQIIWNKDLVKVFEGQVSRNSYTYAINRVFSWQDSYGYLDDAKYFTNLKTLQRAVLKAKEDAPVSTLSLPSIANTLLSNHRFGSSYTRAEAKSEIIDLLDSLSKEKKLFLQTPNEYALSYASAAYDIPLEHSGLLFETDSVPFLQIVLGGCMDMYAKKGSVIRADDLSVLRLIDYNLYPHFTVTEISSFELANSNSNDLYSTEFDSLSKDIITIWKTVNSVLKYVVDAEIIDRTVIEENLVLVNYSNGYTVIINYSDSDFDVAGKTIAAKTALAIPTDNMDEVE